ncbi:hypothetical protein Tco_0022897 [Tanacetum coccineum]
MTGNKCYLDEYEDYDGGLVSFSDGKGRISGKGKIKTGTMKRCDINLKWVMNQTQGNSKEVGTPRYLSLVVPLRKGIDSCSGPRCQDTILGDVDAQTRFETTSEQSNDPPLSKVNTFGSGEDNMKILELMEIVHNCLIK